MRFISYSILALFLANCSTDSSELSSTYVEGEKASRSEVQAKIAKKPEGENLIWSATSLDNALTLVGLGYDEQAKELLESYFGKSVVEQANLASKFDIKKDGLILKSANNIWAQDDFKLKDSYKQSLAQYFSGLEPQTLNVADPEAAADEINQWVSDNTNEMIKDLVKKESISPAVASILVNALYFKGTWHEKFDEDATEDSDFQAVTKSSKEVQTKKVPTMRKYGADVEIADADGVTTVRLPYKGKNHALYLAFASKVTQVGPEDFRGTETSVKTSVDVADVYKKQIIEGAAFKRDYFSSNFSTFTLPKFTIETKIENIQDEFFTSGYGGLFASGALNEMTDDQRAAVSEIFQKAKIIVNEEGSEAAAATGITVRETAMPAQNSLLINGPFAFAIRADDENVTLFEGIVRDPSAK